MTAERLKSVQEYYFSKKLREVAARIEDGKPVINMGIGSPDLPPHPAVTEALQAGLSHPKAHMYQSYQGLPALRAAIAAFYATHYQSTINPQSEILPLMGSKEGIMHISMAFLNPGDQVLIPDPGYPTYASVTKLVEAEAIPYALTAKNNWQPDFEALEALDCSKIKLMWINYPHMPTGAKAHPETFNRLIAWAQRKEVLLVNDNPYSFVLNDAPESILSYPGAKAVAMELNSLSKTFNMAGWRVGWLAGNSTHVNAVLKVKSNMDSGMFYGLQQGAIAALQLSNKWFSSLNAVYRQRRAKIEQLAQAMGVTFDPQSVGMFVWAKLPDDHRDAEEYIDHLLEEKNLFLTPGTIFGKQGQGYIRFSLCVPEEKINQAITRIKS